MSETGKYSIVEFFPDTNGHQCGYCKTPNSSVSHGMWAHSMSAQDYQTLIDRGWRRSGKYCYKPIMTVTCCPAYTIRCCVQDFKLSRSQKKILKRMHHFLSSGVICRGKQRSSAMERTEEVPNFEAAAKKSQQNVGQLTLNSVDASVTEVTSLVENSQLYLLSGSNAGHSSRISSVPVQKGESNKSHKKAKQIRITRKREKLKKKGFSEEEIARKMIEKKRYPIVKTVEDFVNMKLPENFAHTLQIKLLAVNSDAFKNSFTVSFNLFRKYQKAIHKESDDECDIHTFRSFLIDTPLQSSSKYGSFHQQYWLDGKLIAVGVIDILPHCVSSVYFYYDPDFSFLSLGTYGALREISYTRSLVNKYEDLKYYYMGFYIHSCPKMRYKAAMTPSFLLCPEVYSWHPVEFCTIKLDVSKYCRFNEDSNAQEKEVDTSLSDVLVLYKNTAMTFHSYCDKRKCYSEEKEQVLLFARLTGKQCCRKMLLYRQ